MNTFLLPVLSESQPNMGSMTKRLTPREDEIMPSQRKLAPISREYMGSSGDIKAMPSISAKMTMKIAISIFLFKNSSP
jgi:hypothetical protein